MSLRITTVEEAKTMQANARAYGELCEYTVGLAKDDYTSDNGGAAIPKGSECAVVLLLPGAEHPNYDHQRLMMTDYVEEIKVVK